MPLVGRVCWLYRTWVCSPTADGLFTCTPLPQFLYFLRTILMCQTCMWCLLNRSEYKPSGGVSKIHLKSALEVLTLGGLSTGQTQPSVCIRHCSKEPQGVLILLSTGQLSCKVQGSCSCMEASYVYFKLCSIISEPLSHFHCFERACLHIWQTFAQIQLHHPSCYSLLYDFPARTAPTTVPDYHLCM